jgi:hypothetical protein
MNLTRSNHSTVARATADYYQLAFRGLKPTAKLTLPLTRRKAEIY